MYDPLLMGEPHHFRDLTQQVQTLIDRQLLVGLSQKMVESNRLGVVLKDQCRTKLMLGKAFATQDAGVLKSFE